MKMSMTQLSRQFSSNSARHFKVVIAGGGAGGCSVATRLSRHVPAGDLCVIEPSETHYYQPLWTLVGGGIKKFSHSAAPMSKVLPSRAEWIRQGVADIDPNNRVVTTSSGQRVTYDFLVIAMGVRLMYSRIEGALEALHEDPVVCSNYHFEYVRKTRPAFDLVKSGNAVFTFPNGPIKCPGAPQKIMYLFEDYMRQRGLRDGVRVMYNSSLPVIFGVKKYADALMRVCENRNIELNFREALVKVDHSRRLATFENLDTKEVRDVNYDFLHIAPPVAPQKFLTNSPLSLNGTGWISVNKSSMQHLQYHNVFAIGDCIDAPASKTAAAVASQAKVVVQNLKEVMAGRPADKLSYNGYSSCPLLTSYRSAIMAEFDYSLNPLETFPLDQGQERYTMYLVKARLLSPLYWYGLLPGLYNGPAPFRKAFDLLRLGSGKQQQAADATA